MLRAYFGHHKCASTWVQDVISPLCREAGLVNRVVLDPLTPNAKGMLTDYSSRIDRHELGAYVAEEGIDFVSCITADAAQADSLERAKGFHVIRDPRDVIVSAYFSHKHSHPTDGLPHLAAHRERLRACSMEEGLYAEMDFSYQEIVDMSEWNYDDPDILEVKMEDLTRDPYRGFLEVFKHLDLIEEEDHYRMKRKARVFYRTALNRLANRGGAFAPLRRELKPTGEMVLGRVYANRFERKTGGRKAGQENVNSHYRKGKHNDWVHHFSPDHVRYFQSRFGDVVARLGYETSPSMACGNGSAFTQPNAR